jgi:hypothetical protein
MPEPGVPAGDTSAGTARAEEPLLLYEVLVAEYQSQGREPAIPAELLAAWAERRRELEQGRDFAADPAACREELDSQLAGELYRWLHEQGVRRSALCFSGGGIRSATFGLGVLQGLARWRLLRHFDYLSTVSGGGYLGGWLTAWIHREHERARAQAPGPDAADRAVEAVEAQLAGAGSSALSPEPEPLRHLRSYSRYMTPKAGFLSADTWTLVGIYLRNILLNWRVLLPLAAALLMFPRLSSALIRLPETQAWPAQAANRWQQVVLWTAIACGLIAFAYMILNRPGVAARCRGPWSVDKGRRGPDPRGQGWFLLLGLLPLWLLALAVTIYWGWVTYSEAEHLQDLRFQILGREISPPLAFTCFGAGLCAGGFALSRLWVRIRGWSDLLADLAELALVTAAGALGGFLAYTLALHGFPDLGDIYDVETYVCFAAPLVLLVFLVAASLFVGLASRITSDEDREWLARAGSWTLIVAVMRGLLSAVVVFGPLLLAMRPSVRAALGSVGGISGLITIYLGRSEKTPKQQREGGESSGAGGLVRKVALALALPVFCLFLIAALSLGTSLLMKWLQTDFLPESTAWAIVSTHTTSQGPLGVLNVVYNAPWRLVLLVAAIFVIVGAGMGWFVNINNFSLHAAYRDRLIRAYLGASRPRAERRPNAFTGFDEDDDLQICELAHPRPLHVLNLALNLVGGKDLAWQDRKAAPFTVSRLHAGSHCVGYRGAERYAHNRWRRRSITLGTAVAISGAAASPNMGYHSSPLVTLLMTLFNVRLGWWLGNPGRAGRRTFSRPGPGFAPRPLFAEAFGQTTDDHPWVYLSDGGHFENLGLYEMVLRRCHFIVVSDGSQDPELAFEDLGNAVSKIRIDLGVPIVFQKLMMEPRDPDDARSYNLEPGVGAPYCALGRICYSCVDKVVAGEAGGRVEDGFLLYIKASLNGTEPVDVYNYARAHTSFPHEPTENQLYTEPQFESYRALGSHVVTWIVEQVGKQLPAGATMEDFFAALQGEAAVAHGFGQAGSCEGLHPRG